MTHSAELKALCTRTMRSLYVAAKEVSILFQATNIQKNINNINKIIIQSEMNTIDVQNYVVSRILELLHKETLDTYRVRNNNVFTSLIETRDIVQRCSEMKVKTFETVKALAGETIDLLKTDTCLQFKSYTRDLLIQEIDEFLKKNSDKLPTKIPDVERVLFCLNKCIEENKQSFLMRVLEAMDNMLLDSPNWQEEDLLEQVEKLDTVLSALCVQLINEGYSKQFLFLELKYRADQSYENFHKALKEFSKKKKRSFEVVWRLRIEERDSQKLESLGFKAMANVDKFDEYAKVKFAKRLTPTNYTYFFQEEIQALDRYSAARASRETLMRAFDGLHLGVYSKKLELPDLAIVLEKIQSGWYAHNCVTGYFLDGLFSEDYTLSAKFLTSLEKIYRSSAVDDPAKDRIRSAIRHLNYGDLDSEIDQRFINYWIALEFIFASPHTSENTYTRLKTYLIDVLAVSYIKRNVDYLRDKLVAEGIIAEGHNLWETKETLDAIANKPDLPLIWKYKLKKMKSRVFSHEDKLKHYYSNHIKNLERHIARIYNLRNSLVHEGAIKQDVESLASNLRYYLVFLLDQMIKYFASHAADKSTVYKMGDFFNEYHSFRRRIDHDFTLETMLSIPVNKELW